MNESNAFPHAAKTYTFSLLRSLGIETGAGIAHDHVNFACMLRKSHFYLFGAAVLHGIAERFLQNAEKAKTNLQRNSTGNIALELDVNLLPFSEFHAPSFEGGDDTQIPELGGVQFV